MCACIYLSMCVCKYVCMRMYESFFVCVFVSTSACMNVCTCIFNSHDSVKRSTSIQRLISLFCRSNQHQWFVSSCVFTSVQIIYI